MTQAETGESISVLAFALLPATTRKRMSPGLPTGGRRTGQELYQHGFTLVIPPGAVGLMQHPLDPLM